MQRQIARSLIQADGSGLHLRRDLHGEPGQIVTADTHFIDFRVDFVRARNHLHAAIDSVGVVDGQPHRGDIGTLHAVPTSIVLMPRHRHPITGAFDDEMGHDKNEIGAEYAFSAFKPLGMAA